MSEEHGTLIKTPSNLSSYALALVTPVAIALLGAQLVTGSKRIDTTEDKKSVEQRVKPVGELVPLKAQLRRRPPHRRGCRCCQGQSGDEVYNEACVACHGTGAAGAPKRVTKVAWAPCVAQGVATLYDHAIRASGVPPKGGASALSDAEVKAGVDLLV